MRNGCALPFFVAHSVLFVSSGISFTNLNVTELNSKLVILPLDLVEAANRGHNLEDGGQAKAAAHASGPGYPGSQPVLCKVL